MDLLLCRGIYSPFLTATAVRIYTYIRMVTILLDYVW